MSQGCPLPGQPIPHGQHGTFYAHNGYWCLNSDRYYGDISGAVGGFIGLIAHIVLLALEGVAVLAVAALLLAAAARFLGPATRSRRLSQGWRRLLAPGAVPGRYSGNGDA